MTEEIRCHYDVLGLGDERDADTATIKKKHRKLALKFHPDKNIGDETAAQKFRLIQNAYECLSDPRERKWYDEHRDAILAGWSASSRDQGDLDMLFDVVPLMSPGCYDGYSSSSSNFYQVYKAAFADIVECERRQSEVLIELPTDFGDEASEWADVSNFYQHWESFQSALNFAWQDKYNAREDAPDRQTRRLMEDDNKKARSKAKKIYNQDIVALVLFVKKRDPRVKEKQAQMKKQKQQKEFDRKEQTTQRKAEQQKAKEIWLEKSRAELEEAEEDDRLAGRIRLADLEDDYDYGGGKKKRGKKKKKNKQLYTDSAHAETDTKEPPEDSADEPNDSSKQVGEVGEAGNEELDEDTMSNIKQNGMENEMDGESGTENDTNGIGPAKNEEASDGGDDVTADADADAATDIDTDIDINVDNSFQEDEDQSYESSSSEESEEPEVWRCECCKKDFKSEGQIENHMKSKKHKEKFKKYQAKMKAKEEAVMAEMMDEMVLDP